MPCQSVVKPGFKLREPGSKACACNQVAYCHPSWLDGNDSFVSITRKEKKVVRCIGSGATLPQGQVYHSLVELLGVPGGRSGKESACQCRRHKRRGSNPWVGEIPWRRAWQPTPVFWPGRSYGHRSLVGYSPRGPKA